MFDELYPEATATALTARLNRPAEPQPTQRFTISGLLSAAPKGLAAGAAQALGSTSDMLGAFGSVMGASGGSAGGMFATQSPEERKQQQEATDKLLASGPDYMSEGGRSFRNVAKDYTPDPVTTHFAEGAVFNLFRMGGKAITAAATMGNIAGAVVAGAEEGFTMADELAGQGVDLKTRTQVGAVNAAMNAAAFALPAAGKTWMQTGALALVGGPVSFVAQQAATREILQSADYSKQAEQYDPFDPVGLALSTILPLGFGALAMRGAKVRAKAGEVAPDAPPAIHPSDEIVDAARVSLVRQHMDSTNPIPGDLAAADAHVKAYSQAMDQMAAGQRVSVDVPDVVALRASEEMAARVRTLTAEVQAAQVSYLETRGAGSRFHGTGKAIDALSNDYALSGDSRNIYGQGFYTTDAVDISAGYMKKGGKDAALYRVDESAVNLYDMEKPITPDVQKILDDTFGDSLPASNYETDAKLTNLREIYDEFRRQSRHDGLTRDDVQEVFDSVRYRLEELGYRGFEHVGGGHTGKKSHAVKIFWYPENDIQITRAELKDYYKPNQHIAPVATAPVATESVAPKPAASSADGQPASPHETRLAAIEARNPAVLDAEIATAFDDKGKPTERMTVRDYLDQVKREALADTQDAGLLEVAANCFLSGGL